MTGKSKVDISGRSEDDGTHIDLAFSNGEVRSFHLPASHALYDNFAAHGFGKKVRDQIAASKTVDEAVKQVDLLLGAFGENKWNVSRNNEGGPVVGILAQALSRLYGRSLADAQEFVGKLSKKQQADLRKEPSVASTIAVIASESAKQDEGTQSLLASFGSDSEGFAPVDAEVEKESHEAGN